MIIYIRSSLFRLDVRAQKYVHFMEKNKVTIVQWDRELESSSEDNHIITFRFAASYGKKLKSLFKFIKWNLFVLKILFQKRQQYTAIQVCDLDSFFPALFFKLFEKKIVFDVYDFFTDSKISNTTSLIYKLLYHIEMFSLRFADLLILPLESRKKHLNFVPKNLFVCENIPLINEPKDIDVNFNPNLLNVVYAGTLESGNRGLEWIPELASKLKNKVHFFIAGTGPLSELFQNAEMKVPNLTFLGKISHPEALSLQRKGHLIYGVYRTHLLNNVMAAPNKFYESCYLGTPLVTNEGLFISDMIEKEEIGFVLDENQDAIFNFLNTISNTRIVQVSENAQQFWKSKYINYLNEKYQVEYQAALADLVK